jgi:hypothetical protein
VCTANVSLVIPTIHPTIGLDCGNAINHQSEFGELCAKDTADRAVLGGALAMAWTIIDIASQDEERRRLLDGVRAVGAHESVAET